MSASRPDRLARHGGLRTRDSRIDLKRLVPLGELRDPARPILGDRERPAAAAVEDQPHDAAPEIYRALASLPFADVERLLGAQDRLRALSVGERHSTDVSVRD